MCQSVPHMYMYVMGSLVQNLFSDIYCRILNTFTWKETKIWNKMMSSWSICLIMADNTQNFLSNEIASKAYQNE